MSDSAFTSAPYAAYTTEQLEQSISIAKADGFYESDNTFAKMEAEVTRRGKVAQGDVSVMTAGERLRFNR